MATAAILFHVWCCARFDREDWEVSSSRIPAAFDGFRVTLLTDLHGATFGKDGEKLLQAVTASDPDLIAISGDLVDRFTADPARLYNMLQNLAQIAPTYYVTGNHEWDRDDTEQIISMVADSGITVLRGNWKTFEKDGEAIILGGVEDPNGYADSTTPEGLMEHIRANTEGDPFILILSHRNNQLQKWASLDADLVLSGHGHGGVVRLPFVGGLLSVERTLFPKDCEGLLTEGNTTVAVSRGLGGIRFWNTPHIPTVVLRSELVKNS